MRAFNENIIDIVAVLALIFSYSFSSLLLLTIASSR